jgi:hypothetical protein
MARRIGALTQRRSFSGTRGRPPKGIEIMLRMYFLPVWYDLADEVPEDAVYDSGHGSSPAGCFHAMR